LPASRVFKPTLRELLCQTSTDLLAKEVQTGFTVSYTWLADQGGHLLIGFGLMIGLGSLLDLLSPEPWFGWYVLLGSYIALVIFSIELSDVATDVGRAGAAGVFPLDRGDLLYNMWTATIIMWLGVLAGLGVIWGPAMGLLVIAGVLASVGGFAVSWLPGKIAFQQAGLPFIFRLADSAARIEQGVADAISQLSDPDNDSPPFQHVLIVGELGAGKTSLGVAVATEFAFRCGFARYLSFAKLLELSATPDAEEPTPHAGRILWPWAQCDLLVIDDVEVPTRLAARLRPAGKTSGFVLAALDEGDIVHPVNARLLRQKRTVWLLNSGERAEEWAKDLGAWLVQGHPGARLLTVDLRSGLKPELIRTCFTITRHLA
jgi:hypothetical protein